MLMIQRRPGQRIVLTGGVEILISTVRNGSVRLAITAPKGVLVLRGEIHDRVASANAIATGWDGSAITAEGAALAAPEDVLALQEEEQEELAHDP